jgi:hypothetical protein
MKQYCGCIDQDCSVCYEIEAPYCFDFVALPSLPDPNATYVVWIRDKFGNLYFAEIKADGGVFYLTVGDFSHEIFSLEFGCLTIFASTDSDGLFIAPFTVGYTEYNCITLCTLAPVYLTDECGNYLTDESGNYILA